MENAEAKKSIEDSTEDGDIIKATWIHYYDGIPYPYDETPPPKVISLDMPFNDAPGGFVTIQTWVRIKGNHSKDDPPNYDYYLVDQIRKPMNFPEMLEEVAALIKKWHPVGAILVDRKKNDPIIIDILTHRISGVTTVKYCPVETIADKEKNDPNVLNILIHNISEVQPTNGLSGSSIARCHAMSFLFKKGRVHIPKPYNNKMSWVEGYKSSLLQFPAGTSNDEVDATTQALYYLFKYPLIKSK